MKKLFTALIALCLFIPSICIADSVDARLDKAWELYNLGKYKQVLSIVEPLASKGNARAQVILGSCYENGLGLGQSPAIAVQWYQLAAEQGNSVAMERLGYAYAVGNGVVPNFQLAVQWMANAAERGAPGAIEQLAIWDKEGKLNQ